MTSSALSLEPPRLRALPYALPFDASSSAPCCDPSEHPNVYVDEALGVLVERANLVRERERAGGARVKTVHVRSSVVCFESVDSPVIGHPFLDALRFAFVHECAFVLNPHTLWTLVADALAGFFRDMPTLCTMIEARRAEVADFADGRARFFIDTPSSEISEDPIGTSWLQICKDVMSNFRQVAYKVDKLVARSNNNDDAAAADAKRHVFRMDPSAASFPADSLPDNELKPIDLFTDRVTLPLPESITASSTNGVVGDDDDDDDDASSCDTGTGRLSGVFLERPLREWVALFHGVYEFAAHDELKTWCTRLLWFLYHIIEHYERFTKTDNRVPVDDGAIRLALSVGPTRGAQTLRDFFRCERDARNGQLRLFGHALYFFPTECGFFASGPTHKAHASFAVAHDVEIMERGLAAALFGSTWCTYPHTLVTPSRDINMCLYHGPIGFVRHPKSNAIALVTGSFAVVESDRARAVPVDSLQTNLHLIVRSAVKTGVVPTFEATDGKTSAGDHVACLRTESVAVLRSYVMMVTERTKQREAMARDMIRTLDANASDPRATFARVIRLRGASATLNDWPVTTFENSRFGDDALLSPLTSSSLSSSDTNAAHEHVDKNAESDDTTSTTKRQRQASQKKQKQEKKKKKNKGNNNNNNNNGKNDKKKKNQKNTKSNSNNNNKQKQQKKKNKNTEHQRQQQPQQAATNESGEATTVDADSTVSVTREAVDSVVVPVTSNGVPTSREADTVDETNADTVAEQDSGAQTSGETFTTDEEPAVEEDAAQPAVGPNVAETHVEPSSAAVVKDPDAQPNSERGADDEEDGPPVPLPESPPLSPTHADDDVYSGDEASATGGDAATFDDDDDDELDGDDRLFLPPTPAVSMAIASLPCAVPIRIVSGPTEAVAVRRFVRTCLHPSHRRAFRAVAHYCPRHRYGNAAAETASPTLYACLLSTCDMNMACVACAAEMGSACIQLPLIADSRSELLSVEQFSQSTHAVLTSVTGGTTFRACMLCKAELNSDAPPRCTLLLTGVDVYGSVHFRLLWRCGHENNVEGDCTGDTSNAHGMVMDGTGYIWSSGISGTCTAYQMPHGSDPLVRLYAESGDARDDLLLHLPPLVPQPAEFGTMQ